LRPLAAERAAECRDAIAVECTHDRRDIVHGRARRHGAAIFECGGHRHAPAVIGIVSRLTTDRRIASELTPTGTHLAAGESARTEAARCRSSAPPRPATRSAACERCAATLEQARPWCGTRSTAPRRRAS